MTQQYLAGELSLILGQLQGAMTTETAVVDLIRLRHRAERAPWWTLACVASDALAVATLASWDSLIRGDAQAFLQQAAAFDELREFSDSADLLADVVTDRR